VEVFALLLMSFFTPNSDDMCSCRVCLLQLWLSIRQAGRQAGTNSEFDLIASFDRQKTDIADVAISNAKSSY
jgi:hypothetical protein